MYVYVYVYVYDDCIRMRIHDNISAMPVCHLGSQLKAAGVALPGPVPREIPLPGLAA